MRGLFLLNEKDVGNTEISGYAADYCDVSHCNAWILIICKQIYGDIKLMIGRSALGPRDECIFSAVLP